MLSKHNFTHINQGLKLFKVNITFEQSHFFPGSKNLAIRRLHQNINKNIATDGKTRK